MGGCVERGEYRLRTVPCTVTAMNDAFWTLSTEKRKRKEEEEKKEINSTDTTATYRQSSSFTTVAFLTPVNWPR